MSILLLVLISLSADSQPPPGITENPEGAVRLRTIWRLIGTGDQTRIVGTSVGALDDVDGDGYSDVSVGIGGRHHIFRGGDPMSLTAVQVIDSTYLAGVETPTVGDFFGNDQKLYGYIEPNRDDFSSALFVRMRFYQYAPENRDSFLVRTGLELNLPVQFARSAFYASDLNGDGADELVVINKEDGAVVVRIYQGGEDFQLDVPSWEFRAEDTNSVVGRRDVYSSLIFFDGDSSIDLIMARSIPAVGTSEIMLWWGNEQSTENWSNIPDRVFSTTPTDITIQPFSVSVPQDFDGDNIVDHLGVVWSGANQGSYLWLSSRTVNHRNRIFNDKTYDASFPQALWIPGFGSIADSTQTYEMMALGDFGSLVDAYGLGGGTNGPNTTYDAHFGGSDGPAFGGIDAGDVDGNGWRDRLIASSSYGGPGVGGAVIVAGGPYIPSDDPTVSVNDAPVAGIAAGMHLWPNPVSDRLHIAWRGDLPRMPRYLQVFDLQGQLVSETPLAMWSGIVEVSLAEHQPGTYTALLLDPERRYLGDVTFIIQR